MYASWRPILFLPDQSLCIGRGSLLTNYFSQNCAWSFHDSDWVYLTSDSSWSALQSMLDLETNYTCFDVIWIQYVGGDAHTVPFEAAPGAVVRARAFMQKRIMQALNIPAQFNEVLRFVSFPNSTLPTKAQFRPALLTWRDKKWLQVLWLSHA